MGRGGIYYETGNRLMSWKLAKRVKNRPVDRPGLNRRQTGPRTRCSWKTKSHRHRIKNSFSALANLNIFFSRFFCVTPLWILPWDEIHSWNGIRFNFFLATGVLIKVQRNSFRGRTIEVTKNIWRNSWFDRNTINPLNEGTIPSKNRWNFIKMKSNFVLLNLLIQIRISFL